MGVLVSRLLSQIEHAKNEVEIILIDDGSTVHYKDLNKIFSDRVHYVELDRNLGRSKVRNQFLKLEKDGFGDYQGYTVRPNKREKACVSTLTTALLRCCVVVFVDLGDVFLDRSRTRIHARRGNAPSGGHQGWEDGP